MILAVVRELVAEKVAPRAAEIDATGEFPWDIKELFARERSARHSDSRRVRRPRRHLPHLRQGRRRDREGMRVERADRRGARARHAADRHRRQRRTEAPLPAEDRVGRAPRRLCAHRSLQRLRRARLDAHARREARRYLRAQRAEDLDHQRQRRRRRLRFRRDRSRRPARAASPRSSSRKARRDSRSAISRKRWASAVHRPSS